MSVEPTEDMIAGEIPTEAEVFYHEWGRKACDNALQVVSDALKQLVTLVTALLGGSVAFLSKESMPAAFRTGLITSLLFALIVALVGLMPRGSVFDPGDVGTVRQCHDDVLRFRARLVRIAATLLVVAFVFAALGLAFA